MQKHLGLAFKSNAETTRVDSSTDHLGLVYKVKPHVQIINNAELKYIAPSNSSLGNSSLGLIYKIDEQPVQSSETNLGFLFSSPLIPPIPPISKAKGLPENSVFGKIAILLAIGYYVKKH